MLSEGQFGMPSVDGESFYSSPSSTSATSGGTGDGGGDATSGNGDAEAGSGLKLIRLEEVSRDYVKNHTVS